MRCEFALRIARGDACLSHWASGVTWMPNFFGWGDTSCGTPLRLAGRKRKSKSKSLHDARRSR